MIENMISLAIALVGCGVQLLILRFAMKREKRSQEILELAKRKRKAALTILEFAELWRRNMSDDDRTNLVIEWHERLAEANVDLRMDDEL